MKPLINIRANPKLVRLRQPLRKKSETSVRLCATPTRSIFKAVDIMAMRATWNSIRCDLESLPQHKRQCWFGLSVSDWRIYPVNPIYTYTEGISSSALVIVKIYFLQ